MDKCKNCGEPVEPNGNTWYWMHTNQSYENGACWNAQPEPDVLEKQAEEYNSEANKRVRHLRNKVHQRTKPLWRTLRFEKKLTLDQLERIWAICQKKTRRRETNEPNPKTMQSQCA